MCEPEICAVVDRDREESLSRTAVEGNDLLFRNAKYLKGKELIESQRDVVTCSPI